MGQIRDAFEKWADDKGDWPTDKYVSGNYEDENCHAAWDGFRAGINYSLTTDWKVWPKESPELGSNCEIWTETSGNQFTKFDVGTKNKPPYFYWCGSPKEVWWRYIKPPINAKNTKDNPDNDK